MWRIENPALFADLATRDKSVAPGEQGPDGSCLAVRCSKGVHEAETNYAETISCAAYDSVTRHPRHCD